MGSTESKTQDVLPLEELPGFFKDLAKRLEQARANQEHESENNLSNFSKIRIRIKRDENRADVKMKVKWDLPERAEEEPSSEGAPKKIKYKTLKKRMDKSFKTIWKSLEEGVIPQIEIVQSYLEDAAHMATYPDKGTPFYDNFEKACSDFSEAIKNDDIKLAIKAYEAMKALKEACHDRYK
jgi:XXXCH domain-containing protein